MIGETIQYCLDTLSLNELQPYLQDQFIQNLNLKTLTNKLTYFFNSEHNTLIKKKDFRLKITIPEEANCLGCSVGGILGIDVKTLQNTVLKLRTDVFVPTRGAWLGDFLNECKSKHLFEYRRSGLLQGITHCANAVTLLL